MRSDSQTGLMKTYFIVNKAEYPSFSNIIRISFGLVLFGANFKIQKIKPKKIKSFIKVGIKDLQILHNLDISNYSNIDKLKCLRNCVDSDIGLTIFNRARSIQIEENIPQGKFNF